MALISPGLGFNPFSAAKKAAKAVGHGATTVVKRKEFWAAAFVAAGTAAGLPPNVTVGIAASMLKGGGPPKGTDPKAAAFARAYAARNPPPLTWWDKLMNALGVTG